MMNKKGFAFTIPFIIFTVVVVGLIAFLISDKIKWILIGIAVLVGFVFILGKAMTSEKPFRKGKILVLLIFLGIGVFFIIGSDFIQQSVLSPPTTVTLQDGKVFWIMSNVVDSMDEGYTLNYRVGSNVNDYKLPNDNIVKPQQSMSLTFSKQDSYCYYTMQKNYYEYRTIFLVKKTFMYWTFNNPNRIVNVHVQSSDGQSVTWNGAQTTSKIIYDSDGKGSVVIKSLGLLSGVNPCPSNTNIAIYVNSNGFADHVYRDQIENEISKNLNYPSESAFIKIMDDGTSINTQFLNTFTGYSSSPLQSEFKGDLNIGSPVITLTADQDYFDSIIYIPPKEVDPVIIDVNCPPAMKVGDSTGMSVKIKNYEDSSGYISIEVDGTDAVITPTSRNVKITDTITVPFTITADSEEGTGRIDIEVCSTDQFYSPNCDTDFCKFDIEEDEPLTYCGDGTCQLNEGLTTCPEDCEGDIVVDDLCENKTPKFLGWTWVEKETVKGRGPFGILGIIGLNKTTVTGKCVAQFLPYYIGGLVIIILGTVMILTMRKAKKKKRRKK